MTSHKRRTEPPHLVGMPASQPEWQAQRDDAREREIEKTRALRAARLAAQAKTAERASPSVASKAHKAFGAIAGGRRRGVS